MAYKKKFSGNTDKTIKLGGTDTVTNRPNPSSVEGYFLGSKDTESDYGPGKLHIFQTPEGTVGVWGKTRMNSLLTEDLKGQMVKVNFTGMIAPSKKGRKPSYGYEVLHDDTNVVDTANIDLNAAEPAESDDDQDNDFIGNGEELAQAEISRTAAPAPTARPAGTSSAERQAAVQAILASRRK